MFGKKSYRSIEQFPADDTVKIAQLAKFRRVANNRELVPMDPFSGTVLGTAKYSRVRQK